MDLNLSEINIILPELNMKKTLSVSIPIAWTRNRLTTISVDCETHYPNFTIWI
jgi:hypothetical protein